MKTLSKEQKKLAKITFIVKDVLLNYHEHGLLYTIKVINRQRSLQGLTKIKL